MSVNRLPCSESPPFPCSATLSRPDNGGAWDRRGDEPHSRVDDSGWTRERLTDVILVACPGVSPGESGGPAVDLAGKVVGVIEGSGSGIATLTAVRHLTSPQ